MSAARVDYTREARPRRDTRADVIGWQEYVTLELERFADHTAGNGRVWADTARAARYVERRRAGSPEEYGFAGPWHVVRNYVTLEFRQWVEEYEGTERLTFAQWVERARLEDDARDYVETADYTLGQLIELRRLTLERDALIVQAAARGATKVAIAAAIGLTRQQIHAVLAREDAAADSLAPVTPITAAHGAYAAGDGVDGLERGIEWQRTGTGDLVAVDVPF